VTFGSKLRNTGASSSGNIIVSCHLLAKSVFCFEGCTAVDMFQYMSHELIHWTKHMFVMMKYVFIRL